MQPAQGTLHVTNGDSTAGSLRAAFSVEALVWRDALHVGPVPAGSEVGLRRARARFLGSLSSRAAPAVESDLAARDRRLGEHRGDFLLWFEADLYDQLQLAQALDALRRHGVAPGRIGLINVGEVRLVARFTGLGQLPPQELTQLLPQRVTLSAPALALASQAWAALRHPDPSRLESIAGAESPELRFLGEAFRRLMQEYPGRSDGLSLTQRRILLAVAAGAASAGAAFQATARREPRPFLGDTVCLALMAELAQAPRPLLEVEAGGHLDGSSRLALTEIGRQVLAGLADHWALNGAERWIGGVRLTAGRPIWRYDERWETLTGPG